MGTIKTPKRVDFILKTYLSSCPNCGKESQDRRYKEENKTPSCAIYRCSKTSVSLRCHFCGLKFTVTWCNLLKSLEKLFEISKKRRRENPQDETLEHPTTYHNHGELLKQYFDTNYSNRQPPSRGNPVFPHRPV